MDRRVTPPTYVSSNVSSYLFLSTKSLQVFLEKKREIEWGISRFRTRGPSTLRRLVSNEWQITVLIHSIFPLESLTIFILFVVFNLVRLVGWGNVTSQGRVEVFYKGSRREVCGTNWDIKEANVVCRQLGFQGAVAAATSASDSSFMYSVQCDGNETLLTECDLTPRTWCWPNRAACVVCIPGTTDNTT